MCIRDSTDSHQFAIEAKKYGGGQAASRILRQSGFLACGIGLPIESVEGDLNGLRIGTPELARWGVDTTHTQHLAELIVRGLNTDDCSALADEVQEYRQEFSKIHFIE